MALTTNEDWLDALADALGLTDGAKTAFIEAMDAPTNAWARGGLSVLYSAAKSVEAVETLNQFLRDAVDWYAGEVDGGPSEDGYFVVRDSAGNAYLLPSPARLMADLTGVVPQGALNNVSELPSTGNSVGDFYTVPGASVGDPRLAYGWNGTAWVNLGPYQGIKGDKAWSPVLAVATDGDRRVHQVIEWVGGEGTKPSTGLYVGSTGYVVDIADAVDVRGPQGIQGDKGDKAWSPVLAVATDGDRRVHQVIEWVGGEGTKPSTGLYVGSTGYVVDIADAVDVRGPQGIQGDKGDKAWSPVFSAAADGSRRVLRVTGWIGGEGDAPSTGQYVGAAGYVAEIADALDIRGLPGTGFVPMGEWAVGTTYVTGDAVSLAGKSYASLVDGNIGVEPGVTADWDDSWMVIADPAAAIGIGDIAGLTAALADKADKADTYTKSQVDALLAAKLDATAGPYVYQGGWDASTNTPAIPAAASGNKGHVYKVTVAGATDIDGTTDWKPGDQLVSNGASWDKIDNSEPDVISQADAEAGTATDPRIVTALRMRQGADAAIDARVGTTEGKLLALGAGGKVPTDRIDASYLVIDDDYSASADLAYPRPLLVTGNHTITLPDGAAAGWHRTVQVEAGFTATLALGTNEVLDREGVAMDFSTDTPVLVGPCLVMIKARSAGNLEIW